MKLFVIANVLCIWMAGAPQIEIFEKLEVFEKQAISSAQKISASDLDEALPNRPFARWFRKVVGRRAGVVWQLTECGEKIGAPGEPGQDLPACAEIIARLRDGRNLFIAISVGTFKKGLTGKPTFFCAFIEQNEELYRVRRLSDLPGTLRALAVPTATGAKNQIVDLPAVKMYSALIKAPFRYLEPPSSSVSPVAGGLSQEEESPPTPPPPSTQILEQVPESVSLSRAITKINPAYPSAAKKMKAKGTVQVEVAISKVGLVVYAKAISGHLALRDAAEMAARNWVFEPATLNGEPISVKSVLTFVFAPSAK
jgi:TonB family protein